MSSTVLLTGGSGYVGYTVAKELAKLHFRVVLLDLRPPSGPQPAGITFIQGDICNFSQVSTAIEESGARSVIHCAGFGLCGTSNLPAFNVITRKVNVVGTEVVVEACLANDVRNLVFTSTVNVAFNGARIIDGTEESHKWASDHCDVYSSSKQVAEKLVVESNGKVNKFGNSLKTCTLRLAGVYGPGEMVILGRSLRVIQSGILRETLSQKLDLKIDFVHIKNVVQAHVKALQTLEGSDSANGQMFNITDGQPTDLNFFLDPLYSMVTNGAEQKLPKPRILVPFWVCYLMSRLFTLLSVLMGKNFALPFWGFTVMETYKIHTDHYFNISKAREVLKYRPEPCNKEDWIAIRKSFHNQLNPGTCGSVGFLSSMQISIKHFFQSAYTYAGLVLGTLYFYFVLFGSLLTLGI